METAGPWEHRLLGEWSELLQGQCSPSWFKVLTFDVSEGAGNVDFHMKLYAFKMLCEPSKIKLLCCKGNHKQDQKTTIRMGENICK